MPKTSELLLFTPADLTVPPRVYTEEQLLQIDQLRTYAFSLLLPETDPYCKWERRWLNSPGTIARYMRAAKWRFEEAKTRIRGTMLWRREYKPDLIPPEEVRIESETGKIVLNGFDIDGRPILYMRPGNENTKTSPRQLRHLVFCLERARDMLPENQDSVMIIVDYRSTTLRTNPSIGTARKVLTILQQHYVETLGRAIVTNLPTLLTFFYKGISPFLDPVTRDKMRFNPDLLSLVSAEYLDNEFGGRYEYQFEPVSYWKQIVERCCIAEDGTRTNWPAIDKPVAVASEQQGTDEEIQKKCNFTENKAADGDDDNSPSDGSSGTSTPQSNRVASSQTSVGGVNNTENEKQKQKEQGTIPEAEKE